MKCRHRSERESEFLELELNLVVRTSRDVTNILLTQNRIRQNNAKLEDRVEALLSPEDLNGDNK